MPKKLKLSTSQIRVLDEEVRSLASGPATRMAIERFLLGAYLLGTSSPASEHSEEMPIWLARACQIINRPEHSAEGVSAFVRLCGRSPEHVARTCRSLMGKSPTDVVNAARLAHAARELRMGSKAILEIALECGFNNLAHFYELFGVSHGTTPRRYRLECQRGVA
jgi:AraC family cel operon transcriptional repressor